MFHFLLAKLPKELVVEIALFEGRIFLAYLCDYVSEVYSGVYMSYFGRRYSLKYITEEFTTYHSLLSPLPFFSAWSTIFRAKFPEVVKSRKPHKFMRPFVGIIPKNVLLRERKALESRIDYLFPPPCKTHIEIPFVRSHIVHRLTQPTMQNRMRYLIHVAFR